MWNWLKIVNRALFHDLELLFAFFRWWWRWLWVFCVKVAIIMLSWLIRFCTHDSRTLSLVLRFSSWKSIINSEKWEHVDNEQLFSAVIEKLQNFLSTLTDEYFNYLFANLADKLTCAHRSAEYCVITRESKDVIMNLFCVFSALFLIIGVCESEKWGKIKFKTRFFLLFFLATFSHPYRISQILCKDCLNNFLHCKSSSLVTWAAVTSSLARKERRDLQPI